MTLVKTHDFKFEDVDFELNTLILHKLLLSLVLVRYGCLTGLHTLKIKETDRLEALKLSLQRAEYYFVTNDSLTLLASNTNQSHIKIATYNDHRMAMAFAPLALKVPIIIENAEVVSKSYPDFWEDLKF
jgi:3-phosphoshikimate 1-carboxyvinyltransferase